MPHKRPSCSFHTSLWWKAEHPVTTTNVRKRVAPIIQATSLVILGSKYTFADPRIFTKQWATYSATHIAFFTLMQSLSRLPLIQTSFETSHSGHVPLLLPIAAFSETACIDKTRGLVDGSFSDVERRGRISDRRIRHRRTGSHGKSGVGCPGKT